MLLPEQPGRKVTILGDTCGSSRMKDICFGSNYLIHETTLENDKEEDAIGKGHSTPKMAANFAKESKVKNLILTHFSQRYRNLNDLKVYKLIKFSKIIHY